MDSVGLVKDALQRARDAIQGAPDLKISLRRRYGDYSSVIESLRNKPDIIATNDIERELRRLTELFTRVANLLGEYTAAPADGTMRKFNIHTKRAADHEEVNNELNEIDADVKRQLAIMNAKGALSSSEMEVLQRVEEKVDHLASLVGKMRPPSLPDKAAVPAGALALPRSYVKRACVQEAAENLIDPEQALTPYTVVGMGGGGKTVLASAVVRESTVREHFRGGIFWVRVGSCAKNYILPLLQGLAREMGAAPTDTPHGVPHVLDSLDQVKQHLAAVASTGASPRLVVLDDVWEREVVDEFLLLGLKVLVTTRIRTVVGVQGGLLELGDMEEDEALELLLTTSGTVGRPGSDIRTHMTQVVALCGRLPLVLAIAGSMPVVKGKGLTAGAWAKLIEDLDDVAEKMRSRGEQSTSIKLVLETSLDALSRRRQKEFLQMAVLAAGAVAPVEMLRNIWEIEDTEGTQEAADGLVHVCLLQKVEDVGYRVHDLVLEFLRDIIKVDVVDKAIALQVAYLRRLDVLEGYRDPKHGAGNQGLFVLDRFWRSVEELSEEPGLEVASYHASLGELEPSIVGISLPRFVPSFLQPFLPVNPNLRDTAADVAGSYSSVGQLFNLQGKFSEAEPLCKRTQEIFEKILGRDHRNVATILNNRAGLLKSQGKYGEAEPLYERSLAIRERVLGPEHPDVAESLNNRAVLLSAQGKFTEAEPLYERCQEIEEKVLGPEHPSLARTLNNRAWLLERQGKFEEAGPLYDRSRAIREKALGPDHPDVAQSLNNRAGLLYSQGKLSEAEPLYKRTQEIFEKSLGADHPNVATILNNRAELLRAQGKYNEADPLYVRVLQNLAATVGEEHPNYASTLNNRALLLEGQGKLEDAEPLYVRVLEVLGATVGEVHPNYASALNNRAGLLESQGKYSEAEPLYVRAIAIGEKVLGPEHPDLAVWLNNRAGLLKKQGNYDDAEPLYERATEIWEKSLGRDHPTVATVLNNRAWLLESQDKHNEALPLLERASSIRTKMLGENHYHTVDTRISLERLCEKRCEDEIEATASDSGRSPQTREQDRGSLGEFGVV
eukprot:g9854.t1